MSRFLKYAVVVVITIIFLGSVWYLMRLHEMASKPNWPKSVHRRLSAVGMVNVYDADSGTSLFWHHTDPDAEPIRIEKQDENHWIVVFEKRK